MANDQKHEDFPENYFRKGSAAQVLPKVVRYEFLSASTLIRSNQNQDEVDPWNKVGSFLLEVDLPSCLVSEGVCKSDSKSSGMNESIFGFDAWKEGKYWKAKLTQGLIWPDD